MRLRRALRWLAAGVLLSACAALASTAVPRTIVVRGQAHADDGGPLAGARVMARGTVSVSAVTDDRGRYTLSLPLGMPAALLRHPFRIEVRAEHEGRRLPLAGGGASLVVNAGWQPATGTVRVHSNREAAAVAIATALEVEEVTIAWIEADFGAAAAGGRDGSFEQQAALPGSAPARARAAPPSATGPVAAPPTAAPRNIAPAPRATPARNSVPPAPRPPAATPKPSGGTASATRKSPPKPAPRDTARIVATARAVDPPPARPSPVRAIDPLSRRDSVPPADTCRCVLRGTVEIEWERPLEIDTPIRVEIDAPGVAPVELSLFMGAPREFRFRPMPCGDWTLTLVAGGRLDYADEYGDTTRVVPCREATETRIVLRPVRR